MQDFHARCRNFTLLSLCILALLLVACTRKEVPKEVHHEVETLSFENAPGDVMAGPGATVTLSALAKTNSSEPIHYVWEKLIGEITHDISQTSQLELKLDAAPSPCNTKVDGYRVIASAGEMRVEKTFAVSTLCGPMATRMATATDDIAVAPGENVWISPNEKLKLTATTKLTGATIKWEQIQTDKSKTLVSAQNQYDFQAPSLSYPCEMRDIFLSVTATANGTDRTKTISIRVQNPKCVLNASNGLSSDDTTKLLVAKDDSIYIGSNNGLTRWEAGNAKTFTTGGGGRPLQIVTALGEADSKVFVGKARKIPIYPVKGFGIETMSRLVSENGVVNYVWENDEIEGDHWISEISFAKAAGKPIPIIVAASNYTHNGGAQVAADLTFKSWSPDPLAGESLYAVVETQGTRIFGGDGGLFFLRDDKVTRFDGKDWAGKSGLFGSSSNRSVRALVRDGLGNIWIGLQAGMYEAGGIIQYTPSTSDITQGKWSQTMKLPGGNDVRALAVDGNNSLWIATNDGLAVRKSDGTIKLYRTTDGLPSNDIRDVAYDIETENIWVATSAGATRWSMPQVN